MNRRLRILTLVLAVAAALGAAGSALATAAYSPVLGAPLCSGVTTVCDSGTLLESAGQMNPQEQNQPNTLDTCTDGNLGSYLVDESVERIAIRMLGGGPLEGGFTAQVDVTVWAWNDGSDDTLDLYYAADAENPTWVLLTSLTPPAGGLQTLSTQYILPSTGAQIQAVRANFRYLQTQSSCSGTGYTDTDDLAFAVGPASWTNPWQVPSVEPAGTPYCGDFEGINWPAPGRTISEPRGYYSLYDGGEGILLPNPGPYQWGGTRCGGYCSLGATNQQFGCAMRSGTPIAGISQWIDTYFPQGSAGDVAYYDELFAYAMGETYHVVTGATSTPTRTALASDLLEVLDSSSWALERTPVLYSNTDLDGKPAAFFFDDERARIAWNQSYATSGSSSDAYYLEQLGHLINWARCRTLGASPSSFPNGACPSDPGGSAGARFRDALLAMGSSTDIDVLREVTPLLHPRTQLAAAPNQYQMGSGDIFVHSDGQSSVAPIDIIDDQNSYTRSAVQTMLAADGSAGSIFGFLEAEWGITSPQFTYVGQESVPRWEFVVFADRLEEVRYWLPENTSANNIRATEFWYTVAQAFVDTVHEPLETQDLCVNGSGSSSHHMKLSDTFSGAQSEDCLHRDALAHAYASIFVLETGIDREDSVLLDDLFTSVFPTEGSTRDLPEARRHLKSSHSQMCVLSVLGKACVDTSYEWMKNNYDEPAQAHNQSAGTLSSVNHAANSEAVCEPDDMSDYENPSCSNNADEGRCVLLTDSDQDGEWTPELRPCSEEHRILCQEATRSGSTVSYATFAGPVTDRLYPLAFADEACALEFPVDGDSLWTGAWDPTSVQTNPIEYTVLGSGAHECTHGSKRPCTEVSNGSVPTGSGVEDVTLGRKRTKRALAEAISHVATVTTTQQITNFDALRVRAVDIGAGSCHLIQCEKHRTGQQTTYDNVLVDCGSLARGTNGLDAAGAVAYLAAAGFYSSTRPPLIVATHADSDHFKFIPNLLFAGATAGAGPVRWTSDVQTMYLGGWGEEYVGRYTGNTGVTEATRVGSGTPAPYALATGEIGSRGPFWAYLVNRQVTGGLTINGTALPAGTPLPLWLRNHPWQNPAGDSDRIYQFNGCGGATVDVIVVNTPATPGDPDANTQSVRRNRASAVLELRYPSPIGAGDYFRAILPGDALGDTEAAAIDKLDAAAPGSWSNGAPHRLLMSSHHGSGRHESNHALWRTTISPTRVMYSAGELFKHPRLDVVEGYHRDIIGTDVSAHTIRSGALVLEFPAFSEEAYTDAAALTQEEIDAIEEADYEDFFGQNWDYINLVSKRRHNNTRDNGSMHYSIIIPIDQDGNPQAPSRTFKTRRSSPPPPEYQP